MLQDPRRVEVLEIKEVLAPALDERAGGQGAVRGGGVESFNDGIAKVFNREVSPVVWSVSVSLR